MLFSQLYQTSGEFTLAGLQINHSKLKSTQISSTTVDAKGSFVTNLQQISIRFTEVTSSILFQETGQHIITLENIEATDCAVSQSTLYFQSTPAGKAQQNPAMSQTSLKNITLTNNDHLNFNLINTN